LRFAIKIFHLTVLLVRNLSRARPAGFHIIKGEILENGMEIVIMLSIGKIMEMRFETLKMNVVN
jgi:hypothetical protein